MPLELLAVVTDFVDRRGGAEGYFSLPMSGVHVLRSFQQVDANHALYRPSLCVVVQGAKQFLVGDRQVDYRAMQGLIVSMDLPACGRIVAASPDAPFIGLTVEFDTAIMRDVLDHLEEPPTALEKDDAAFFVADIEHALAHCLVRLVRLAETPQAIAVLYPSLLREIYYWLLIGPHGSAVCRLALPETHLSRIAKAIWLLREQYTQPLPVDRLAAAARMSVSSFHHHFKALTGMTPLQFQKQLRLLEARRLMLSDAVTVADAAYRVGYESASQFSREYSRAFGQAPKRDTMSLKASYAEPLPA
jgi:AraC-like DNA-binding protein